MKTGNARSNGNWQGMNWIRQEKRLAIYLRDGCACGWCGASLESGAILSLDHVIPHSKGGSNKETNLVTCCKPCNDRRGARSAKAFSEAVAQYLNHGVTAEAIRKHVRACQKRGLAPFLVQAKKLVALRGSAFAALKRKI